MQISEENLYISFVKIMETVHVVDTCLSLNAQMINSNFFFLIPKSKAFGEEYDYIRDFSHSLYDAK